MSFHTPSRWIQASAVALFCLLFVATALSGEKAFIPGIEELYRLDRLAEFKESIKVASVSSYDTTGGNNDGFGGLYSFVRKEKEGLVLADLKGPGVIYRIWTPTPTDDTLFFYFDDEKDPRIQVKFRDFFLGKHPFFERPLVGFGAGGFYSYVPISYEKSCKILIHAEKMQFYQINYATYPPGTGIKSYSSFPDEETKHHTDKAKSLFNAYGSDISTYVVPENGEIQRIKTNVTLFSNKPATLFEKNQPGRIVGIHLSPSDVFKGKKRDVVLRAWWDGDKEPAILCPAGDFFGYAWGEPAMKSLMVGTAQNTNYCYFPMPFDNSARIELFSESELEKEVKIEAEVLFVPLARKKNEGKFYALWRRENPTTLGKPFTFIETKGRGHIVGVVQQSQAMDTGHTYFFEGDDQTTIDGNLVIHGTGSEDFYNGGWYDVPGRWEAKRSFPLSGCLAYKKHLGRTGGYRFMLGDTYAFRKSILQTIEHAPRNNDMLNDYCGLTFLYSEKRPTFTFELPKVSDRHVMDPQRIVFAAYWNVPIHSFSLKNATLTKTGKQMWGEDKGIRYLSMRAKAEGYFGNHSICFTCELPAAGLYKVSLDVMKGPELAIVQLFQDEAPAGPALDLYNPERIVSKEEYIATLELEEGPNNLLFELVDKNKASTGLGFDVTNIIFERIE